jgi:hypothetical protein
MPSSLLVMFVAGCALMPFQAAAQDADVAIAGTGLLSIEPIEDKFRSPYLSAQIGRFGTGFGTEFSAIIRRVAIAGEVTTSKDELIVSGRLVNGSGPNEGRAALSIQRQTFLTFLGGFATKGPNTRAVLLGGLSKVFNRHWRDGIGTTTFAVPWSVTTGLDVTFRAAARVGVLANARYTFLRVPYDGYQTADDQVLQIGAGVRIRLN